MLWSEKYRPKNLKDIIGQDIIINSLTNILEKENMPHLLFQGNSGTGKTSCIWSISQQVFGDKLLKERVIEINASEDRGIKMIRDKIKKFAGEKINKVIGIPDYKIIILDEADTISQESQTALRRCMEDYSNITRFCIICNKINKIIQPIISRCCVYYFNNIQEKYFISKLIDICQLENIKEDKEMIENIFKISNGDLRKGINYLQYYSIFNNLDNIHIIDKTDILKKELLEILLMNNCNYQIIQRHVTKILHMGYNTDTILISLIDLIYNHPLLIDKIDDMKKGKIGLCISDCNKKISNGSSEYLNIMRVFVELL